MELHARPRVLIVNFTFSKQTERVADAMRTALSIAPHALPAPNSTAGEAQW